MIPYQLLLTFVQIGSRVMKTEMVGFTILLPREQTVEVTELR